MFLTYISIIYIRSAPEYYESIKQPIDLLKIQQKLKTEEYDEIEQLTEDVQLLVKNAKSYYQVRVRVCAVIIEPALICFFFFFFMGFE